MAAIYRHGLPPSMNALLCLLDEDREQNNWRQYMATVNWSIGRFVYKGEFLPLYTEMLERSKPDNRTADEVIDDLADKIRKRLQERSEKA